MSFDVLITEDDPLHRSFLKTVVKNALPEVSSIFEADDGETAMEIFDSHKIKYIIMDLQMERKSGVEAAKYIWKKCPDAAILFWSNYSDEAYVRGVSRIVPKGATYGYLLKTASEESLKSAIRGVFLRHQCIIDREVRGVQLRSENYLEGLTDSEFEVLQDIALGMTDRSIAAMRKISTRGVQSRLKHLYNKLGMEVKKQHPDIGPIYNSRTRAISVALSRGLLNAESLAIKQKLIDIWIKKLEE